MQTVKNRLAVYGEAPNLQSYRTLRERRADFIFNSGMSTCEKIMRRGGARFITLGAAAKGESNLSTLHRESFSFGKVRLLGRCAGNDSNSGHKPVEMVRNPHFVLFEFYLYSAAYNKNNCL